MTYDPAQYSAGAQKLGEAAMAEAAARFMEAEREFKARHAFLMFQARLPRKTFLMGTTALFSVLRSHAR